MPASWRRHAPPGSVAGNWSSTPPAKSRRELEQALADGVAINIDNFQELSRVDDILSLRSSTSDIGIRINPQTGSGAIEVLSTASRTSKFGIALDDEGNRTTLREAYLARPWLRWMHVHVGSQGVPLRLTARGVARVVEFAEEINARAGVQQVIGINVGGGLSVNFGGDDDSLRFHDHVAELMAAAPALFCGGYRVVTEFGKSLLAKNGCVEYTKSAGGRRIAITHAGSQVAMRTTMVPDQWPLRVAGYNPLGRPRLGPPVMQDLAGPCCFAGDLVASGRPLPLLEQGDIVTLLDTGAYYFSAPYRYNSLPEPAVHGFELTGDGDVAFKLLRRAETVEELIGR